MSLFPLGCEDLDGYRSFDVPLDAPFPLLPRARRGRFARALRVLSRRIASGKLLSVLRWRYFRFRSGCGIRRRQIFALPNAQHLKEELRTRTTYRAEWQPIQVESQLCHAFLVGGRVRMPTPSGRRRAHDGPVNRVALLLYMSRTRAPQAWRLRSQAYRRYRPPARRQTDRSQSNLAAPASSKNARSTPGTCVQGITHPPEHPH